VQGRNIAPCTPACRTPPVGLNQFVINGIAPDIHFLGIMRGVMPFIAIMAFYILLFAMFPDIVKWFPDRLNGSSPAGRRQIPGD
jgi:TRAP-type C4-dicarboxylate transport system permease large subunit